MNRCVLLVPIMLLAACSETSPENASSATVDTLANGAIHVRNGAAGTWDSASSWRFEEIARIGALEGEGPDVFGDVRDVEVDALGRIYVLDTQRKHMAVFEPDGRLVRTIGGPGAGPGEIEDANGIEFDPQGRLWLQDPGNARFSVYDTTGTLVATHRRDAILFSWIWPAGITRDGRMFDIEVVRTEEPGGHGGQVLIERDTLGVGIDTFALPEFEQQYFELSRDDGRMMMRANVPYSPNLEWDVGPDGSFWFGTTDQYRLVQRTLDGDTLRIVEKAWTPLPVTQAERDTAMAMEYIQEIRSGGGDVDPGRIPANKPAWSIFWLDDRGYLWVVPMRERGTDPRADVFDPDGTLLGSVGLPPGMSFMAPLVVGDRMYVIVRDEMEVAYVVVGRLVGRDAGS